ncbi:MAG: NAD(P)-binding domain-containing protein [Chloroflexota bacterium]
MSNNRVAIIGAGPAGLATGRVLKLLGIPFTIFEKHSGVGGIWDRSNAGSPMYRSAHFISSKTMSGHVGYPMPDHYPDYPSNGQILDYIRSFASAYHLTPHIRFNTAIESVERDGETWVIDAAGEEKEAFRWLVCASGTTWFPNRPALRGEETFNGEIMHSVSYGDSDMLRDKRVLVVGAGNSGVDIACDAAFAAQSAHISLRRGYHFIPKHIFGLPADVFAKKTGGGPMWLEQAVFGAMLRVLNGDLTRLGLQKPDHKVMSSHPIMNTQILHYLQHGDLKAHQDINYLDGDTVHFVDGSSLDVDLIILATGYRWHVPYLPEETFQWRNSRPELYLNVFAPAQPSLFVNGFIETNGGAYHLFDDMGYLIGKTIESQYRQLPEAKTIIDTIQEPAPNLSGKIKFVESARHTNYANGETFEHEMKKFRKKFGWPELEDLLKRSESVLNGEIEEPAFA